MKKFLPLLGLLCALSQSICPALFASERPREQSQEDPAELRFNGSLKTIGALQRLHHEKLYAKDYQPQLEERVWLTSAFTWRAVLLEFSQEATFLLQPENLTSFPITTYAPVNAWDAEWGFGGSSTTQGYYRITRLFLQLSQNDLEFRVGKQVLNEGVGKIFAAINQVPRLPFTMVDQEYQRGEDAVAVKWGRGLVLEAKYLPKTRGQSRDNFRFRAKAQKTGYDIGLTTGRTDDKFYIGLETAGNLGENLLRAEIVGFHWQPGGQVGGVERETVQALLGYDHVFGPKWSLTAEAFYNGFGDRYEDYRLATYPHRSSPYRGKLYAGMTVVWETTGRLKTSLGAIANVLDPSALFQLSFNYSLGNSLDILAGQYVSWSGQPQGEFGGKLGTPLLFSIGLPDITYAAFRFYF